MKMKLHSLLLLLLIAFSANALVVTAQTATAAAKELGPLALLPSSDVVAFADVRRIVSEAVPRLLAKNPELLGQMMGMLNEVRTKTGFNLLAIDRIAVGVKLVGPMKPGMKKENIGIVIIAQGDFDASGLLEFIKREGKGKTGEETYGGKLIYSEPRPDPPRVKADREVAAAALLDPNTLVVGDLPQVRATIDAAAGKDRIDPALAGLALRDESAVLGVAAYLSPSFTENLSVGAAPGEIERAGMRFMMALFKHAIISIGSTPESFNLSLGLGFCDPQQAQSIRDMLNGLRKAETPLSRDPRLRGLLDSTQVTAEGNEMRIRVEVKNEILQAFIADMMKPKAQAAPSSPATQTAPTRTQQPKTQRRRSTRRRRG
jgi:hypothetical protein